MNLVLNLLPATSGGNLTRAEAFIQRFHTVAPGTKLIILKHPSVLSKYKSNGHLIICNIPLPLDFLKIFRRLWWENFKMKNFLKNLKPDVYLTFSHSLPFINLDMPTIVGVSNLAPFSKEAYKVEPFLIKIKLKILKKTIISSCKKGNTIIALSKTCKKLLVLEGIPEKKIVVAPNGVDTWWNDHETKDQNITRDLNKSKFMLYVSHFHRYKNHINLINAYSKLPKRIVEDYSLVLVGRFHDKNYMKDIYKLIEYKNLKDHIVIFPSQPKEILRSLYRKTSLFLFPSFIENCPNILLEAMMSGSNIISSNINPMPEFGGDAASYFDPNEPESIYRSIMNNLLEFQNKSGINYKSIDQAKKYTWDSFTNTIFQEVFRLSK